MSLVWQDGQFSWAIVASIAYLSVLLLAFDLLWRLTPLGGRRLFWLAALAAIAGTALIFVLLK